MSEMFYIYGLGKIVIKIVIFFKFIYYLYENVKLFFFKDDEFIIKFKNIVGD